MYTSQTGISVADSEDVTKQDFRLSVWKYMTDNNIARFPLPVNNRIPNFQGCGQCGNKLSQLPEFTSANTIKVNPDKPQEEVRFWTLALRKKLLVPSPRLISGLFNLLENESSDDASSLRKKSQAEGVKQLSIPISLEDKIKVDLIVIGSVAVSKTGHRIGKGEGFADLEYAMMKTMNAIDDSVLVVTTVHDCQVFDDLPSRLLKEHDVPIDIIVTPSKIIATDHSLNKPKGIYWHLLSKEKFKQVPILRKLYHMEKEKNIDVTLKDGYCPSEGDDDEVQQEPETQQEPESQQESEAPRERDMHFNTRRGQGRFMRRGGKPFFQQHHQYPYAENVTREYTRSPFRGRYRGQGRGRDWNRRPRDDERTGQESEDKRNIQVTINVDKKNHIVRREVEETNQFDRVGHADDQQQEKDLNRSSSSAVHNDFSIYVGAIPKNCRYTDLKTELYNRNVKPNYIAWKMNGYAFLNFYKSRISADDVLDSLKGLSLQERELKLDLAPINKYEGNNKPERNAYRPQREGARAPYTNSENHRSEPREDWNGNSERGAFWSAASVNIERRMHRKLPANRPMNIHHRSNYQEVKNNIESERNEVAKASPEPFRVENFSVEVNNGAEGGWEEPVEVNNGAEGGWEEPVEVNNGAEGGWEEPVEEENKLEAKDGWGNPSEVKPTDGGEDGWGATGDNVVPTGWES